MRRLLDRLPFDPESDHLWLVGDLVNRGPQSLEVLTWAIDQSRRLGKRFCCVLGNHEIHLLRIAEGLAKPGPGDRLEAILASPERERLLDWVAQRPLLHRSRGRVLVHAGLLPAWSITKAERLASKAGKRLASAKRRAFLSQPGKLRRATTILTTIRAVDRNGEPAAFSGAPERAPKKLRPWFHPRTKNPKSPLLVFGHWAALGLRSTERWICLDSGCVWGRSLSAIRLDDRKVFQVKVHRKDRER